MSMRVRWREFNCRIGSSVMLKRSIPVTETSSSNPLKRVTDTPLETVCVGFCSPPSRVRHWCRFKLKVWITSFRPRKVSRRMIAHVVPTQAGTGRASWCS